MKIRTLASAIVITLALSTAAIAGSISERLVQPGEFIRENTPVATIVQMSPLKLKTAIQEKNASLIKPGQAVEFDVEAFLNRKFKGTIAIEYEHNPSDPSADVKKCVEYLRAAGKNLG